MKSVPNSDIKYQSIKPDLYGLNARTVLRKIDKNHIGIVKKINSRILRKDAQKIIDQAEKIRSINNSVNISLICSKNICSKSIALLNHHQINIIIEEI